MARGRNLYEAVKGQYRNLSEAFEKRSSENFAAASAKPSEPCVFLSHRSTDKPAVIQIGEYIMSKGIDVYIDIDDPFLQQAVAINDHKAITAAIELGISKSTDLLAYLTAKTQSSVWVPYEIGFAKRAGNYLAAMKSKDLATLPSYLHIVREITGIDTLNAYLQEILVRKQRSPQPMNFSNYVNALLLEKSGSTHPLNSYLAAK